MEGQFRHKINYLCLFDKFALFELKINIHLTNPVTYFMKSFKQSADAQMPVQALIILGSCVYRGVCAINNTHRF